MRMPWQKREGCVAGVRTYCMTTSCVVCRVVLMPGHEMLRDVEYAAQRTWARLNFRRRPVTRHPPENKHCVFIRFGANTALLRFFFFLLFKWSNKSLLQLSKELLHVCIPSLISRLLAGMCGMFPWSKRYPDCPPTWLSWERVSHDPKWDKLWMREDWLSGGRQSPQFI